MIVPDRRISWFRLIFEVRGSALVGIRGRLFAVFVVACMATGLFEFTGHKRDLTTTPFTIIGLALGVFLGFRNNTAYDRYWEGRRLWGRLVNDARSFARMALTLIAHDATGQPGDPQRAAELSKRLVYRMIAYAHGLRVHLRGETNYVDELKAFVPKDELEAAAGEANVPFALMQHMSEDVQLARREGLLRDFDVQLFENLFTDIIDVQGGCERIRATPIPWSYTVLIHSIVATYCFALPFGLVGTTHWLTPLVTALIAYAFLGLDAVGDEIEEPFGTDYNDLPLNTITRMIEVNLRTRLGEAELPPLLEPDENRVLL